MNLNSVAGNASVALATNVNSEVVTMSSREIAQLTGKNHADVLRDIRSVLSEAEIGESKFAGSYFSEQNKELPCYNLPKRECDLVITGYSVKYRLAVIDRWHELEAQVRKPVSQMQMIAQMALAIDEQQQRQLALEAKQLEQEQAIKDIKASNNAVLLQSDYFSVMGYCNLMGIKVTLSQSSVYSRSLGTICKRLGIERQKVVDPRFGDVYIYSREVLHDFFVKKGLITI